MADAFAKYVSFEKRTRKTDEKLQEFIADWENLYEKVKQKGCSLSDMVLTFKLLESSKLTEIETNLVLTGVNFSTGKEQENMLTQVKESLRKFVGRSNITTDGKKDVVVKTEETYVTKEEMSLFVKRFNKKREPLKCYLCKCECEENCNHPCVYHLADKCKQKKGKTTEKPDLSLFMKESMGDLVLISEDLKNYCLIAERYS